MTERMDSCWCKFDVGKLFTPQSFSCLLSLGLVPFLYRKRTVILFFFFRIVSSYNDCKIVSTEDPSGFLFFRTSAQTVVGSLLRLSETFTVLELVSFSPGHPTGVLFLPMVFLWFDDES